MLKELLKSSKIIVQLYENAFWTYNKINIIWRLKRNARLIRSKRLKCCYKYNQPLTSQKRFLAIDFDDF